MDQEKQLERLLAYKQDPDLALMQEVAELGDTLKDIDSRLKGVPVRDLEALRGEDGKTPLLGEDYFTDAEKMDLQEEIQQNVEGKMKGDMELMRDELRLELAPIKGIDYQDGRDGVDGIDGITPVKYVDYFSDEDINEFILSSVAYIEGLKGDARIDASAIKNLSSNINYKDWDFSFLSIDAKQIRNLPKPQESKGGGGGNRTLVWLNDITNAASAATGTVLKKRSDGRFEFGSGSGTGDMLAATYDAAGKEEQVLTVGDLVDEDNMVSDSAVKVPSQQSVKAYVDGLVGDEGTQDVVGAMFSSNTETGITATYQDADGTIDLVTEVTLAGAETLTNKTLTSPVLNTGVTGTAIKDEDDMASDSATHLATQQSIKAYVDAEIAGVGGGVSQLSDLSDVGVTTATNRNVLVADGDSWESRALVEADISDLGSYITSVAAADITDATADGIALLTSADANPFTDADESKLDGIEASADVTDTANVTAAGALMDSEVTNLAQVKAFDSSDYATAAQGSTADSALQDVADDTTPQLGGDLDVDGNSIVSTSNGDIVLAPNGTGIVKGDLKRFMVQLLASDTDQAADTTIGGDFRISNRAITIKAVGAYVDTAGTTGTCTIDINEAGTSILSTKITIDSAEKSSEDAATAPVISDSAIAADAIITFDIDGIHTTAAKGLKVWIDYVYA